LRNILALVPGSRGDDLRRQIEFASAHVSGEWSTYGELRIGAEAAPVTEEIAGPLEAEAIVVDETEDPIGGILIWLDEHGYLATMEYFWYTDERPLDFPRPNQLRPTYRTASSSQ
jgi:hypothetical protein